MSPGVVEREDTDPQITAVIPLLDAAGFLDDSLGSVVRAAEAASCAVELVIVDNGSTDGSWEMVVENWADRARILRHPCVNVGAVRNRGARAGRGGILSFIDADCVVPLEYFDRIVDVLEATGADATGSRYALPDHPHWVERTWHRLHGPTVEGPVHHVNAGNFSCRREAFEEVGGFDETLVTGEDAELCQRLLERGYTIHQAPEVRAVHLGNPKSLGAFFRKHRWHGMGMFGTFRSNPRDLPVLGTLLHLSSLVAAPLIFLLVPGWTAGLALAGVAFVAVPFAAVVYRALRASEPPLILRGVILYHVYFDARLAALAALLGRKSGRSLRG